MFGAQYSGKKRRPAVAGRSLSCVLIDYVVMRTRELRPERGRIVVIAVVAGADRHDQTIPLVHVIRQAARRLSLRRCIERATTDSAGEFFVDAPAAGRYRLGLSDADGHTFVAPVFSISHGQTVQRDPKYPPELRKENLSDEVLTEFVVDTLGRADLKTFRIIRSTHLEFSDAVREWLRFTPATMVGTKCPSSYMSRSFSRSTTSVHLVNTR